jgi:hypothetical protein
MGLHMVSKQIILMGEGDTEKVVLRALDVVGKFQPFNIWKQDIRKILPRLNGQAQLWLYIDTDLSNNQTEFERFKSNIQILKKAKRAFKVFFQVNDLEDELRRACINDIYDIFSVPRQSKSELKYQLTHCTNLQEKLRQADINKNKMWQQSHEKCDLAIK